MVSSLAVQLAQGASLNAAILTDRTRNKPGDSYLFTGRQAGDHDLQSIHSLGVNGLLQLIRLNSEFWAFEPPLFSEAAMIVDRTLQTSEENARLDKAIAQFLRLLGPYLMDAPAGKVLEWLIRRFRINEFNVEDILVLFLPYHETPHFAKMVTILHIKPNSTWSFLSAHKSAAKNVPRHSLVTEMLHNSDIARFITNLLPDAMKGGYCHRVLVAFNAATLHEYIIRSKMLDEGTVVQLLPALLHPLDNKVQGGKEVILGSYILLSTLSQKCHLSQDAVKVIVGSMTGCVEHVSTKQFMSAVVAVCELQDTIDAFSKAIIKQILRITDLIENLELALRWVGIERFVCPLLPGLCKRIHEDTAFSALHSICSSPDVPSAIIHKLSSILINQAISSDSDDIDMVHARDILSIIYQRHPSLFKKSAGSVVVASEKKQALDQLVVTVSTGYISLSQHLLANNEAADLVVAASSFDASVRADAVSKLFYITRNLTSFEPSTRDSIQSALLLRVLDSEIKVIELLYSKPSLVLPIFVQDYDNYITYLSSALCALESKPKRSLIRIHLTFLVHHFCKGCPPAALSQAFHSIVFPCLLYSKPRQHTADAVWEIIAQSDELCAYPWFSGCLHAWQREKDKKEGDISAKMRLINSAVASRIAETILLSNAFSDNLDILLSKLGDGNPHVRNFGYLITRALLGHLSGSHQIDAAFNFLRVINLAQLSSSFESISAGVEDLQHALADISTGKLLVSKPSSRGTTTWLQLSILALIANVSRPVDATLNWFDDTAQDSNAGIDIQFIRMLRLVYQVANCMPTAIAKHLISVLFSNIGNDSLAFLAGISSAEQSDSEVRVVAWRHASAFLEARLSENQNVDFQTILPSLIGAIQDPNGEVRQAALDCISLLHRSAQEKFTSVYAFDTLYGITSSRLQYLDQVDFRKYIAALEADCDHLATDHQHIRVFHQQHFNSSSPSTKKRIEYQHRILCFLLSHANCIGAPIRVFLISSVSDISDGAKAKTLIPTIEILVRELETTQLVAQHAAQWENLATLVISTFDSSAGSDLNERDSPTWSVFCRLLRRLINPKVPESLRSAFERCLRRGVYDHLALERQIEVCELLLQAGASDYQNSAQCKGMLSSISLSLPSILRLLSRFQPNQQADAAPPGKRAKTANEPNDDISTLGLFAEVLVLKRLPGSVDLIIRLLETLHRVSQYNSPTQTDVSYIEQLLMLAIENVADNVKDTPNLASGVIRLDILVDVVRVARNPQTFHQALLLIANLTRLAPDSVLHNVMPIFTFMGSNVFHRDDTYSFRVVQKTIDSIVPVMVSSLKKTASTGLVLQMHSRDFLRIFTDAAPHIPRHRRANFFAHLIDVLGPEDFLAPICMLLVEKATPRIIRLNDEDVARTLSLPVSVLHHYTHSLQITALTEVARESKRLALHFLDPSSTEPSILAESHEEDRLTFRCRAQALATFIGNSVQMIPAADDETNGLVSSLIDLVTLRVEIATNDNLDDLNTAAQLALQRALLAMPASNFIQAVSSMMESSDIRIQVGAMDLLSERLPSVSESVRRASVPVFCKITESIKRIIHLHPQAAPNVSAFAALYSITSTAQPGEESSLTTLIPLTISTLRTSHAMATACLPVLLPLIPKLGPRLIPFFRELVTEMINVINDDALDKPKDHALNVLQALLASIPTFWGIAELTPVVRLCVKDNALTGVSSLAKSIAKKCPSKTLLPTLYDMWSTLETSEDGCLVGYFHLLRRSLRSAAKGVVNEHLRSIFKLFLDVLGQVKSNSKAKTKVESSVIDAFLELVIKLNDTSFRPFFRRLFDWAFTDVSSNVPRRITFCHIYEALLDHFKNLLTSYMVYLLVPIIELFDSYSNGSMDDEDLWACMVSLLSKSFTYDEGAFWRDEKVGQIASLFIDQVAVCIKLNSVSGREMIPNSLSSMVDCVTDDAILKSINLNLLMHTRSENAQVRILALTCSEAMWLAHGGKLIGFAAETATFIAECAEDENDSVVSSARKLRVAVESVAGSIVV